MSYKTRLLALVKEVRGEPVANLLALSDVEEIDAYVDSLRRSATLLGQEFPELPGEEEAAGTEAKPEVAEAPEAATGAQAPRAAPKQAEQRAAAPQNAGPRKLDEEERRARLLARIAKVLKVAAPTFRSAPVEELEAFAASLEQSYRQLSGKGETPKSVSSAAANPEGGARYRVLERERRPTTPQKRG